MQHLYVHVPFCQRRCSYCDFSIAVRKRIPAQEFVDVILEEARHTDLGDPSTIYFGGGTPSLLPPAAIATPACTLITISRSDFELLLDFNRDIAYKVLWSVVRLLSARLRVTNDNLRSFLAMSMF